MRPRAKSCHACVIGGAQSTLQDIKLPDSAGGFVYEATSKPETRNRFILWRTSHDVLELSESSMDWSLTGNRVKYRFQVSQSSKLGTRASKTKAVITFSYRSIIAKISSLVTYLLIQVSYLKRRVLSRTRRPRYEL